jgi:N-methylhydantoinase A
MNTYQKKKLFFKTRMQSILILDKFGRVRLSLDNGKLMHGFSAKISADLPSIISKFSSNSDLSPNVQLVDGFQLLDFSSLNANEQVVQAIREQLDKIDSEVLLVIKQ